jgi:hypothetical protein
MPPNNANKTSMRLSSSSAPHAFEQRAGCDLYLPQQGERLLHVLGDELFDDLVFAHAREARAAGVIAVRAN